MTSSKFSDRWFYKVEMTKLGPVSTDSLKNMLQDGVLTIESPVWRDGMESWVAARDVQELFPEGCGVPADNALSSVAPARGRALTPRLLLSFVGLAAMGIVVNILLFGKSGDPYAYRRVSGTVLYENGEVLPADLLTLTFIPLAPPHSPRVFPRPGFAIVDPKTGAFKSVTSRKPGDGLVKGVHKVLITGVNGVPLPENVLPLEYADFKTTPLEIDTEAGDFNLRVKRPTEKPKNEGDKSGKA